MSQMLVDDNEGQKASATSTQGEFPCLLMEPKEFSLVGTEDCSSLECVKLRTSEKATQTINQFTCSDTSPEDTGDVLLLSDHLYSSAPPWNPQTLTPKKASNTPPQ